jgi:hypothetical protein
MRSTALISTKSKLSLMPSTQRVTPSKRVVMPRCGLTIKHRPNESSERCRTRLWLRDRPLLPLRRSAQRDYAVCLVTVAQSVPNSVDNLVDYPETQ